MEVEERDQVASLKDEMDKMQRRVKSLEDLVRSLVKDGGILGSVQGPVKEILLKDTNSSRVLKVTADVDSAVLVGTEVR